MESALQVTIVHALLVAHVAGDLRSCKRERVQKYVWVVWLVLFQLRHAHSYQINFNLKANFSKHSLCRHVFRHVLPPTTCEADQHALRAALLCFVFTGHLPIGPGRVFR